MNLDRLKELMLNDSGFAFDPRTGLTYNISVTGLDIIRWLKEDASEDEIVARIATEYEVDEHTASRDFEAFIKSLGDLAFVTIPPDHHDSDAADDGEPEPVADSAD